jgi:hypothetical protein
MKTEIFYKGYESKKTEIEGMGWEAARDKFNQEYPSGQKWEGSTQGLEFAQGEFEAIFRNNHKF